MPTTNPETREDQPVDVRVDPAEESQAVLREVERPYFFTKPIRSMAMMWMERKYFWTSARSVNSQEAVASLANETPVIAIRATVAGSRCFMDRMA